jgi:SAM-dependent methyltransferase
VPRLERAELLTWLAGLPPDARDAALEDRLGIRDAGHEASLPPAEHLLGYHASGVAPIVHTLAEVPVTAEDVVVDLGSGLGKVVLLAHLLTGARARGIELQPELVRRASSCAGALGLDADADVQFIEADARRADLDGGTVFYLYAPFTGPVLAEVLTRLHKVARHHAIVVCALGLDLGRHSWLAPRPLDSFWLTLYDSVVPGVPPRATRRSSLDRDLAENVARAR